MTVTFAPSAPDLEVAVGPETVTGTVMFAPAAPALTVTSGRPSLALYDEDGNWLANLPNAAGITLQDELSAPGSLSCRLPLDDAVTAQATPKRILKAFWRGGARQAARIDGSGIDVAVDGRRWREFSNLPGVLNMLGDAVVYPDRPLLQASQSQRTFGYPAKRGPWYDSGNWTNAIGVTWRDETDVKRGKPEGLDYPNPSWIAKRGPHNVEPPFASQYFRREFTTTAAALNYQILATADNDLTLWLDGEQIITPDQQQSQTWRYLVQITGTLQAGSHILAARVTNGRNPASGYNPMSLLLTLQQLQSNGDVVLGAPLINSNDRWVVSDIYPGFRRGDVLATLYNEALARGVKATQVLRLGFDHDRDSRGEPWADTPGEYTVDVMASLLDVAQQMTEKDLDLTVDFDTLTINAYNRAGADLFSTVKLDVGGVDGDGNAVGSLVSHHVDRVEAKFNTALVQLADSTYDERQDAASLAAYGRVETGLQLGSTADADTAAEVAAGAFAESSDTAYTFTTELSPLAGKQPYRDFSVGDSIGVPNEDGTGYVKVRVMALTVDATGETVKVTPEFAVDRS